MWLVKAEKIKENLEQAFPEIHTSSRKTRYYYYSLGKKVWSKRRYRTVPNQVKRRYQTLENDCECPLDCFDFLCCKTAAAAKRCFLCLLLGVLIIGVWHYNSVTTANYYRYRKVRSFPPASYFRVVKEDVLHQYISKRVQTGSCNFPRLNPVTDEIRPFLTKPIKPDCVLLANTIGDVAFVQESGTRKLLQVSDLSGSSCCYRPFYRNGDDYMTYADDCVKMETNVTVIPDEYDFVEVLCDGEYRDAFVFVNEKTEWKKNHSSDEEGLNVLILGFDATSHMNFLRTMPNSNKYLLEKLSAIPMNGYTKVAENTLPNITPLLAGLTLDEFKAKCVHTSASADGVRLDSCPFIWKRFSSKGYFTGFSEDEASLAIFNMNWRNSFADPPTDNYLRPFSLHMERRLKFANGYCYGPRLSFQVLLNNLENVAETMKKRKRPFFQFMWETALPHGDGNKLRWGDEPLLKFLQFLEEKNHLSNTAVILMGDHGSRIDEIRRTPQGKIEDRMPLLYLVLPPWFPKRFPKAFENVKANSDRLTSAFDVYRTLEDFMDLSRLNVEETLEDYSNFEGVRRKPLSLFHSIPETRTCFDAGIPLHWCVCQSRANNTNSTEGTGMKALDLENAELKDAVAYAIQSMNYHLREQDECSTLTLKQIVDAFYIDFDVGDEELASHGFYPGKNEKLVILRVSYITEPGEGLFEATLIKSKGPSRWLLSEQVVRTNSYEDQSHCVEQEFKNFCYCE